MRAGVRRTLAGAVLLTVLLTTACGTGESTTSGTVAAVPAGGAEQTGARLIQLLEWVQIGRGPAASGVDDVRATAAFQRLNSICAHDDLPTDLEPGCDRALLASELPQGQASAAYDSAFEALHEVVVSRPQAEQLQGELNFDPDLAAFNQLSPAIMEPATTFFGAARSGYDTTTMTARWADVVSACRPHILDVDPTSGEPLAQDEMSCIALLFGLTDSVNEMLAARTDALLDERRESALDALIGMGVRPP